MCVGVDMTKSGGAVLLNTIEPTRVFKCFSKNVIFEAVDYRFQKFNFVFHFAYCRISVKNRLIAGPKKTAFLANGVFDYR